jgi:hypothetical protein
LRVLILFPYSFQLDLIRVSSFDSTTRLELHEHAPSFVSKEAWWG